MAVCSSAMLHSMRKLIYNIFSCLLRQYHARQNAVRAETLDGDAWSVFTQHAQVRYHLCRYRQVYRPFIGRLLARQLWNPAARAICQSLVVGGIVFADTRFSVAS